MIVGLVSTIIPVYNRPMMLPEAVDSVLSQSHSAVEVIIVNDGSSDDTPQVADQLAEANPDRVTVIHIDNSGPSLAREAGRQVAKGEFIQYLDSDDILYPEKFHLQVEALRNQESAHAIMASMIKCYLTPNLSVSLMLTFFNQIQHCYNGLS